jgi:hypothetical protein
VTTGVAWFLSVPGVVLAVVGGGIPALLARRFPRPPALVVLGGVAAGALIGLLALGDGSLALRLGVAAVVTLAAAPWLAIASMVRWSRHHGGAAGPDA